MKVKFFSVFLFAGITYAASAQGVGINENGSSPDPSSGLDVDFTNKGFLPPRLTTAQRDAISTPAEGLVVYNTENKCLEFFDGTDWISACDGSVVTSPPSVPNICNPSNPTVIVEVTNGATGKTWMDRNLGANRAATSSADAESYGSLYQWGRGSDGHQCVHRYTGDGVTTSGTTATLSSSNTPGHGDFITITSSPHNWRSPQNNSLWQGVSGTNNPCSTGYRLPTEAELNDERLSWSSNNSAGAFASPLKLPVAGWRNTVGGFNFVSSRGRYWSSTVNSTNARNLYLYGSNALMSTDYRALGFSVRCIKD